MFLRHSLVAGTAVFPRRAALRAPFSLLRQESFDTSDQVRMGPTVHRICLTGGPCGGKSTLMTHVTDRLEASGFNVYRVPEAATMMIMGGINFVDKTEMQMLTNQVELMKVQMALEDAMTAVAECSGQNSVVLCDRGLMDSYAYCAPGGFDAAMQELNLNVEKCRDSRYESVIFLVSAADGAEEFYQTANNEARHETADVARHLDKKLQEGWIGHPKLKLIKNDKSFARKMEKAVSAVCSFVGLPRPSSSSRKFVLKSFPSADVMAQRVGHYTQHAVEETYLHTRDNRAHTRLRKRGDNVATTYKLRTKTLIQRGDSKTVAQHVEVSRLLNAREYISLKNKADQRRTSLAKTRRSFIWENHYFELDEFTGITNPKTGSPLVTLKVGGEEDLVSLPFEEDVLEEATNENTHQYSSYILSLKQPEA